ncbi:phosphoenolpyruvate carboxykinase, cytosolic [GTP] isoform X1 [Hydra vulgaris]|uniref:phosphoenolpyruvate carboxykinase, cytosolic [GTP] isoform X1 n=2 Tax=Hydra vulgaris TaxID=6087 RepID=UPI001F5F3D21|nr:phosphoenolpyruvate carboxykinase, cytosolic [GTP] isoform X1 [Hydra vulgaris]
MQSHYFHDATVLNRKMKEKEIIKTNVLHCPVQVINGEFNSLPLSVKCFVLSKIQLCQPDNLHICDGSDVEAKKFAEQLVKSGTAIELRKHINSYAVRTNPLDVARVESKTVICTENKNETIPTTKNGVQGQVGYWASIEETDSKLMDLFNGCMKGRTMYVIPFSMGPIGSPLSKIGIQITDSAYVSLSMRIMTRMGEEVLTALKDGEFIRCSHSVGKPLPSTPDPYNWPCNPENTIIAHFPVRREIVSFGSGYGGNSLLGKKCLALRIASCIGRDEGWLAEHMLILGLTNPSGEKIYIAAAFPSACGKTNLAMITPTIPGWKAECVGDDIAWMKFDKNGQLRAINPENGFFGVAPGTSSENNPEAMHCCRKDTIFTNVATTSDGTFYWEGLEKERDLNNIEVTDWLNKTWSAQSNSKAAHPNSRFCCPARNCKIMDPKWEDPEGVPISAILFGGRRPEGVPLVYEAFDWKHGVFIASSLCSETTAAAEYTGKKIMRDPFAMRPFFGYNAAHYFQHWLNMERQDHTLPKIFHVNWFRKDSNGKFLWPGFGENCRVLKWIMERVTGKVNAVVSPVGLLPDIGGLDLSGLSEKINIDELMSVPTSYWNNQLDDLEKYFSEQFGSDLPNELWDQLKSFRERLSNLNI